MAAPMIKLTLNPEDAARIVSIEYYEWNWVAAGYPPRIGNRPPCNCGPYRHRDDCPNK